jgi:uncharacterized protein YegL
MTQTPTSKKHSRAKQPKKVLTTHVLFVLDESGSMQSTATDVRGGFNTYVEQLKGDGNTYSLTAIKFGTKVRPLFTNLPLEQVPLLTPENYLPLDSTALYDAIGYALDEAEKAWGMKDKPYGEDKFILIIMTDGFENASKQYSKEAITARLKRREEAGNWTLVYMGADQDAWAVAQGLGFVQGNVLSYASNATNTAFASLATSTSTTSGSSAPSSRSFFSGGSEKKQ